MAPLIRLKHSAPPPSKSPSTPEPSLGAVSEGEQVSSRLPGIVPVITPTGKIVRKKGLKHAFRTSTKTMSTDDGDSSADESDVSPRTVPPKHSKTIKENGIPAPSFNPINPPTPESAKSLKVEAASSDDEVEAPTNVSAENDEGSDAVSDVATDAMSSDEEDEDWNPDEDESDDDIFFDLEVDRLTQNRTVDPTKPVAKNNAPEQIAVIEQRKAAGGKKHFRCHCGKGGNQCCNPQQYGPSKHYARGVTSDFFGHTKKEYDQIPKNRRAHWTRSCYQRGTYNAKVGNENTQNQLKLGAIRAQVAAIEQWRPNARYTVQLRGALMQRVLTYCMLMDDFGGGIAAFDAAAQQVDGEIKHPGKPTPEEATPVRIANMIRKQYCSPRGVTLDKSTNDILELLNFIENSLAEDKRVIGIANAKQLKSENAAGKVAEDIPEHTPEWPDEMVDAVEEAPESSGEQSGEETEVEENSDKGEDEADDDADMEDADMEDADMGSEAEAGEVVDKASPTPSLDLSLHPLAIEENYERENRDLLTQIPAVEFLLEVRPEDEARLKAQKARRANTLQRVAEQNGGALPDCLRKGPRPAGAVAEPKVKGKGKGKGKAKVNDAADSTPATKPATKRKTKTTATNGTTKATPTTSVPAMMKAVTTAQKDLYAAAAASSSAVGQPHSPHLMSGALPARANLKRKHPKKQATVVEDSEDDREEVDPRPSKKAKGLTHPSHKPTGGA
ncbi:hypothetical protein M8818_004248 [Zalaria obscura]|uniref:Uncharacterized protein n=1 Tax=Zalaria obscura TaxID=2024903 RepID=A0ACC3SE25_9PEZI